MSNTTEREKEIFEEALAITSAEARGAYLKEACGRDEALRGRIDQLLKAYAAADGFIPTKEDAETVASEPLTEGPGSRIGRYKLLQQIGEGGMGVVYMAEQAEPVRRRVAFKIIKLGMDTRQVVARFEAERQALAMMDHPNIAKVFDGGATDTGRPYFVMELVQGVPITEFCDKAKLSAKERLKLFMQVCQAIQSAHQKGIIHRDIKPSNVLVTLHDGIPVPKVIDFGIAKATNQKLTEKTLFTNFASMIGTPAYMSPEEAEMSGLDIDTRTDIYALGVLLYALLTGTTPFPEKRLRSLGYGKMQRVILEEEPERPSTRLSTMANEEKTIVARNCGEELASLSNLLKGDLDWIVMKCLEKDRQRRYETANGLASDIQRHLSNEPVIARPPSAGYRFQKMLKRNRAMTTATVAIALTLIVALGLSTIAFLRERNARLQTLAAERAREEARREAQAETVRADDVVGFVNGFFDAVLADFGLRGDPNAIKHLLNVAERLASRLTNAPGAESQLRLRIGKAYSDTLNDYLAAEPQFRAVERLGQARGKEAIEITDIAHAYAVAIPMWQNQDPAAAIELRRLANVALNQIPPAAETAATILDALALWHCFFGEAAEAEACARECLRIAPADNPDQRHRLDALMVLHWTITRRGAFTEADEPLRQAFEIIERTGTTHDLWTLQRLLDSFTSNASLSGRLGEAQIRLQSVLDQPATQDPYWRVTLQAHLGELVARNGDWDKGLGLLYSAATNAAVTITEWRPAVYLAALLNQNELYRSLSISGLALFGSGADAEMSEALTAALGILPSDLASHPMVQRHLERALHGNPWVQTWAQQTQALFQYRTGHFTEAQQTLEHYARKNQHLKKDWYGGFGIFLRAAIEAKLGHVSQAIQTYQVGMKTHSPHFRDRKATYQGTDSWTGACAAELLRREAASLLGDATPTDSPAASKP